MRQKMQTYSVNTKGNINISHLDAATYGVKLITF